MQVENGYTIATVVIANGVSLSGAVPSQGRRLLAIGIPATWTAAGIGLEGAFAEAGPYLPIEGQTGTEIAATIEAGKIVLVADIIRIPWLKVRSGTFGAPVNQGADRIVTLFFSSLGA